MRGRYPDGPAELLEALDGTTEDKQRVQAILETVFGPARVVQTCEQLDIGETRFRQLRELALQGALDGIRARPSGRPSGHADAERIRELEQQLAETKLELQQALVRTEVALILPHRTEVEPIKKGPCSSVKLRKRKPR
jgi:transposase-like protein